MVITELGRIQALTRDSLKRKFKNCLYHDWLPREMAHFYPLRYYYEPVNTQEKVRTTTGFERQESKNIHEFIKTLTDTEQGTISILLEGKSFLYLPSATM